MAGVRSFEGQKGNLVTDVGARCASLCIDDQGNNAACKTHFQVMMGERMTILQRITKKV